MLTLKFLLGEEAIRLNFAHLIKICRTLPQDLNLTCIKVNNRIPNDFNYYEIQL